MKKIKAWIFQMWRPVLTFFVVSLVVGCIFGFNLGSLTHGVSQPEQSYISSVASGKQLIEHPVYIVHKLPVYLLFKLHVHRIAVYRAVSALIAMLSLVSCFFILREWYTDRIAVLGTGLFLTSAWILHVGRLATPEASYLLIMPLLWVAVWLYNTTLRKSALLALSICCGLCLYIPGFVWLLILTAAWQQKRIWKELKAVPWWYRAICGVSTAVVILPLLWAGLQHRSEFLLAAGLPSHMPHMTNLVQNFSRVFTNLFYAGPSDPVKWLGRLPLLDAFSIIMLLLGLYSMRYHFKVIRNQLLAGSASILVLLITLGGPVTITALMPLVYILLTGGLAFMLQQWFTVFPNNPIARTIATTLLSVSVLFVSYYHINSYFIAWPQTPATRAVFKQSLLK